MDGKCSSQSLQLSLQSIQRPDNKKAAQKAAFVVVFGELSALLKRDVPQRFAYCMLYNQLILNDFKS